MCVISSGSYISMLSACLKWSSLLSVNLCYNNLNVVKLSILPFLISLTTDRESISARSCQVWALTACIYEDPLLQAWACKFVFDWLQFVDPQIQKWVYTKQSWKLMIVLVFKKQLE